MRARVYPEHTGPKNPPAARSRCQVPVRTSQDGLGAQYEFPGAEGFGQVVVRSKFETLDSVLLLPLGGQYENGHVCQRRIRADHLQDAVTVKARQHAVEDKQVGRLPLQSLEGSGAAQRGFDPVALPGQLVRDQGGDLCLVLDDQNPCGHPPVPAHSVWRLVGRTSCGHGGHGSVPLHDPHPSFGSSS